MGSQMVSEDITNESQLKAKLVPGEVPKPVSDISSVAELAKDAYLGRLILKGEVPDDIKGKFDAQYGAGTVAAIEASITPKEMALLKKLIDVADGAEDGKSNSDKITKPSSKGDLTEYGELAKIGKMLISQDVTKISGEQLDGFAKASGVTFSPEKIAEFNNILQGK